MGLLNMVIRIRIAGGRRKWRFSDYKGAKWMGAYSIFKSTFSIISNNKTPRI